MKTIYIGAGCFWGTEAYYQKIKGVLTTEVGYANGPKGPVSYETICNGSGHVEVAKITFDETTLSLPELFASYIRIINPYQKSGQGNDIGIQYRPGLYSHDSKLLDDLQKLCHAWEEQHRKTVIEILPLINYAPAESNHQDYLQSNPSGYCHINLVNIPPNLRK